jgi:hypothetical protein
MPASPTPTFGGRRWGIPPHLRQGALRLHVEILRQCRASHLLFPYGLEACVLLCCEVVSPVPDLSLSHRVGVEKSTRGFPSRLVNGFALLRSNVPYSAIAATACAERSLLKKRPFYEPVWQGRPSCPLVEPKHLVRPMIMIKRDGDVFRIAHHIHSLTLTFQHHFGVQPIRQVRGNHA